MPARRNYDRILKKHTYLLIVWVNDTNTQKDIPMMEITIVIYTICSYDVFVWCNIIIGCLFLILATFMVSARVVSGSSKRHLSQDVWVLPIHTMLTEVK